MRLKRTLRTAFDRAARWSGVLQRYERRMRRGLTVLMYHRVLPQAQCVDYPFRSLVIPEDAFREQIRWLAEHCEVRTLADSLARGTRDESRPNGPLARAARDKSRSNGPLARAARDESKPRVALTFDDGYADNYAIAARLLDEAGIKATFFVATDFVESGSPLWYDRAVLALERLHPAVRNRTVAQAVSSSRPHSLPREEAPIADWVAFLKSCEPAQRDAILAALDREAGARTVPELYRPMNAAEVADLHRRGHEIGSHSVTHPILTLQDDRALEDELARSKRTLEHWIGAPVTGFCYPNGSFDARVVQAVKNAGYAYACTTETGIHLAASDPLRIRRFGVTLDRVADSSDRCDLLAFRSELCSLHEIWR